MTQLEVAVAAPVRQTYSYLLPEAMVDGDHSEAAELVGRRVFVPFGSGKASGYVIAVEPRSTESHELKEIIELLDEAPLFHGDMVELWRWIAAYYHYPLGQVIKTALPGSLKVAVQTTLCLTNKKGLIGQAALLPAGPDHDWLARLAAAGRLSPLESRRVLATKAGKTTVRRLVREGVLHLVRSCSKDSVGKKRERCYRLEPRLRGELEDSGGVEKAAKALVEAYYRRTRGRLPGKAELKTVLVLHNIYRSSGNRDIPRRELANCYPYGAKVVDRLVGESVVEPIDRRVYRSPFGDLLPFYPRITEHSAEQRGAIAALGHAVEQRRYRTYLLHGITGSGKTEVYLEAAERALALGRGVLVLVPEIALATQLEAHFVSRFGARVALLHSGLSPGERYDEWSRILVGEAPIVIGARSAVFAPLPDLGLVIVDEEHDGGFKQQDGLRYHARDVAIVRAQMKDATVILGSATPAITSFHHGCTDKYGLLTMNHRVGGRALPEVSIVDLKTKPRGTDTGLFHRELRLALQETFAQGKQSILLINRRGFSSSVVCLDCGAMVECRHCKVTMNLHKKPQWLLCHYCGYRLPSTVSCGGCGSGHLHPVGFGTERVAEELAELLPQARMARLDSDTATDRRAFLTILQAAANGEIDVLVGTQMLAKGLHFPEVTLVGIVLADSGLGFPDFRAAEKTYQLIAQVTGRAGRGDTPGRVIIQTLQPDHYAIGLAAEHRYETLAEKEIAIRRQAGFPPFTRLIFILVEDEQEQKARRKALEIGEEARGWIGKNAAAARTVTVLGPAPAAIERLRDRYRWQVLLKAVDTATLHRLADHLVTIFQKSGSGRIIIDVDPDNML